MTVAPWRGLKAAGPKSGAKSGILELLGQRLVLPLADLGQGTPLGLPGGVFVEIDRNVEFFADPLAQPFGHLDAVLHGGALDRDQRADVGGAHPGMGPGVLGHVDQLSRLGDGPEGGLFHRLGRADEGDHGAVGRGAGVDIQEHGPLHRLDLGGDRVDHAAVPPLAEVRHALDEPSSDSLLDCFGVLRDPVAGDFTRAGPRRVGSRNAPISSGICAFFSDGTSSSRAVNM